MSHVLFVCIQNAGRSQMAHALFERAASGYEARSAGSRPAGRVHPEVVEAMREVGLDLSSARPQRLTPELAASASLLVTMGCGEACPYVPGLAREDWPLDDPKGQGAEAVRRIRDEIRLRVDQLVADRGWS